MLDVVAALPVAELEPSDDFVLVEPLPEVVLLEPVVVELVFSAAAWKASKLFAAVGLIANTRPFWQ